MLSYHTERVHVCMSRARYLPHTFMVLSSELLTSLPSDNISVSSDQNIHKYTYLTNSFPPGPGTAMGAAMGAVMGRQYFNKCDTYKLDLIERHQDSWRPAGLTRESQIIKMYVVNYICIDHTYLFYIQIDSCFGYPYIQDTQVDKSKWLSRHFMANRLLSD